MSVQNLCRICLKKDNNLFYIHEKSGAAKNSPTIAEIIQEFTKYKIEKDDRFPQSVCADCVILAKNTYRFKTTLDDSYETAAQLLGVKELELKEQQRDVVEVGTQTLEEVVNEKAAVELNKEGNVSLKRNSSSRASLAPEQRASNNQISSFEENVSFDGNTSQDGSFSYENSTEKEKVPEKDSSGIALRIEAIESNAKRCDICDEPFGSLFALQTHRLINHLRLDKNLPNAVGISFDCRLCGYSFGKRNRLQHHILNVHKFITDIPYELVRSKVVNENYDDTRVLDNITEVDVKCSLCQLKFKAPDILKNHLLYRHRKDLIELKQRGNSGKINANGSLIDKSDKSQMSCTQESQLLQDSLDLSSNDKTNLSSTTDERVEGPKSKECNICKESFKTLSDLQKHRFNVHLRIGQTKDDWIYECKCCGFTFPDKNSFGIHVVDIHNLRIMRTNILSQSMKKDPNWSDKSLLENLTDLDLKCVECDETFRKPITLKSHIIYTHIKDTIVDEEAQKFYQNSADTSNGNVNESVQDSKDKQDENHDDSDGHSDHDDNYHDNGNDNGDMETFEIEDESNDAAEPENKGEEASSAAGIQFGTLSKKDASAAKANGKKNSKKSLPPPIEQKRVSKRLNKEQGEEQTESNMESRSQKRRFSQRHEAGNQTGGEEEQDETASSLRKQKKFTTEDISHTMEELGANESNSEASQSQSMNPAKKGKPNKKGSKAKDTKEKPQDISNGESASEDLLVRRSSDAAAEPPSPCSICNESFPTLPDLQKHRLLKHLRTVTRSASVYFVCCLCQYSFPVRKALRRHFQDIHGIVVMYGPIYEKFKSKDEHPFRDNRVLKNITDLDLACSECDERFSKPPQLRHHILITHIKKLNFGEKSMEILLSMTANMKDPIDMNETETNKSMKKAEDKEKGDEKEKSKKVEEEEEEEDEKEETCTRQMRRRRLEPGEMAIRDIGDDSDESDSDSDSSNEDSDYLAEIAMPKTPKKPKLITVKQSPGSEKKVCKANNSGNNTVTSAGNNSVTSAGNNSGTSADNNTATSADNNTGNRAGMFCSICLKRFEDQFELQKHRLSSHLRMEKNYENDLGVIYECRVCNFSFGKGVTLKKHLRQIHGINMNLQAEVEFGRKEDEYYDDQRLLEHFTDLDLKCFVCEMQYEDPNGLKNHILYRHANYLNNNRDLNTENNSQLYMIKPNKSLGQENVEQMNVKGEMSAVDTEAMDASASSYCCSLCSNTYSSAPELQKHRLNSHLRGAEDDGENEPGFNYDCYICGFRFYSENSFQNHLVEAHAVRTFLGSVAESCRTTNEEFDEDARLLYDFTAEDITCYVCREQCRNPLKLKCHILKNHVQTATDDTDDVFGLDMEEGEVNAQAEDGAFDPVNLVHLCSTFKAEPPEVDETSIEQHVLEPDVSAIRNANQSDIDPEILEKLRNAVNGGIEYDEEYFHSVQSNKKKSERPINGICLVQPDREKRFYRRANKDVEPRCAICNVLYPNRGELIKHVRRIHQDVRLFRCPVCAKDFGTRSTLKVHVIGMHIRKVTCPECENEFISREALYRHRKEEHDLYANVVNPERQAMRNNQTADKKKSEPCYICGKIFSDTKNLKKHMQTHNSEGFACKYCGKVFGSRRNCNVHVSKVHEGRIIPCDICSKECTTVAALHLHKAYKHPDQYP